jgi:hypothetical protein
VDCLSIMNEKREMLLLLPYDPKSQSAGTVAVERTAGTQ